MSIKPYTPHPEQEAEIQRVLADTSGAYLMGYATGVGKSLTATEIALRLWAGRVLIIAPPGTFGLVDHEAGIYDGWAGTVYRQSAGSATLLKCSNNGKHEKANLTNLMTGVPGWYFISRELFARLDHELVPQFDRQKNPVYEIKKGERVLDKDGLPKQKKKRVQKRVWANLNIDVAVYDEVQATASKSSNGFKSWLTVKAEKKIACSADWFGNSVTNMWAPAYALWPDHINPSPGLWADEFLESEYDHFAWNKKKYVAERIPGQFASTLPCYGRLESTLGAEPIPDVRWVDLYPIQRKLYNQLEKNMVAWITEQGPLVVDLPMTLRIRLRQLSLGEFTLTDDDEVDFKVGCKSSKIDEALSIMADHPDRQFVIFTDSKRFAQVAAKMIPGAESYTGDMSHTERQALKGRFVSGTVKHLVCSIQSSAVGLDQLQLASSHVIFLSESDNALLNHQAIGRVWRQGQKNPVSIWKVLARDTFDSGQMSHLMKLALQNNAAKRKDAA